MQVVVKGHAVTYQQTGHGPDVLLLHGWGSDLHAFDPLVPELVEKFRVTRFDWPGFGGSEVPTSDWGVPEYAEFLAAFMAKKKLESPTIIAHSFGGRVVLNALARGLKLHKLVLVGSGGVPAAAGRRAGYRAVAKVGKVATVLLPGVRQKLRKKLYPHAGATDYLTAGPLRETFKRTVSFNSLPDAAKVKVPALLIWGAEDAETPVAQGEQLHQAISGSRFEIIYQAGHYVWLDQPKAVEQLLEEWL